jgi:hypothetical protein
LRPLLLPSLRRDARRVSALLAVPLHLPQRRYFKCPHGRSAWRLCLEQLSPEPALALRMLV